jgi:hypothetical protein
VRTFRQCDVLDRGARERLVQARRARTWQDLIHATSGHHVTAQKQLRRRSHSANRRASVESDGMSILVR